MTSTFPSLGVVMLASLASFASQCIETRTYDADGGVCGVVCPSARPHCEASTMTCVACLADANCGGSKPTCDTSTHTCFACTTNAQCAASGAGSICDTGTGACRACLNDGECAGNAGATVCRESTGQCVACTPDSEATTCGVNSCSRTTFTCTGTARGSVGTCRRCQGDSECVATNHCVAVPFQGATLGNYCLLDRPVNGCGSTGSNPAYLPYSAPRTTTSVDGASVQICGTSESVSCEAQLLAGQSCATGSGTTRLDDACGSTTVHDGVCAFPSGGGGPVCRYQCLDSADCPAGRTCTAGVPKFCD